MCYKKIMRHITYFFYILFSTAALAQVEECHILESIQYPGQQAEKKLNDLLMADYHQALATYYQNRDKAGFMALERFELALQRAIGDIRMTVYIKDTNTRRSKVLEAFQNWRQAFKRAQIKNTLEKK